MPGRYRQVLLETMDGVFAVSVAVDVELDDHGRIVSPRSVFEENSCLVAVEQEPVTPREVKPGEPQWPTKSRQLRHGVFKIQFTNGKVRFVPYQTSVQ
jgi:hypothetical protein